MNPFDAFILTPMSAGDIIDRAARLYRKNFFPLLRIVLAPEIFAYLGLILITFGKRNFSTMQGDWRTAWSALLIIFGIVLFFLGKAAFYAVLGGASRAIVVHLFDGTPLRARDVYRAVRERGWSLIGALLMITLLSIGFGILLSYLIIFVVAIVSLISISFSFAINLPMWVKITLGILIAFLAIAAFIIIFLLVYSRIVYVPQVIMVEDSGVLGGISRSFALAGGQVRRIAALILFWSYVAVSIWLLFMVPLGWFSYWSGGPVNPFSDNQPIWYEIADQTVGQLSEILIAPIVMLGFTLLYIDSRVRKEGFDVKLLADRILPPVPSPEEIISSQEVVPESHQISPSWVPSMLGLNAYYPLEADMTAAAPMQAQRFCRLCETEAALEDRFCGVCGSVFEST
jgi:hypothetical protein